MLIYDIYFSFSDLLHSVWQSLGPSCLCRWHNFIPFYGWVTFHCLYGLRLLYPFPCWWLFRLLPCPGYCKQCCSEHWATCIFLNYGFLQGLPWSLNALGTVLPLELCTGCSSCLECSSFGYPHGQLLHFFSSLNSTVTTLMMLILTISFTTAITSFSPTSQSHPALLFPTEHLLILHLFTCCFSKLCIVCSLH